MEPLEKKPAVEKDQLQNKALSAAESVKGLMQNL